ncbi:MAG: alpha/beta hydrolase-fold protein [Candidatus Eisenbacteria bacterium]
MESGRVQIERFESTVLKGNPLGDPFVRRIPVYLPPSYDSSPERRYPVVFLLSGFTGRGLMMLNDQPWSMAIDERMDRLIASGRAGEMILVMPDCFTRFGGSQYLDSPATGRYETHVVEELVPWMDRTFRTMASREHRGVAGKSSGGYGALVLGMKHPGVFGAVACQSGDLYFEYCYRADLPKACSVLQEAGGVRAFLERFESQPQKGKDGFVALEILGMAACYSADPNEELGVALPFDLGSGAFRPEIWKRWLEHDPLHMLEAHADALRSLRLLYLDCGTRDEFHLHHGLRLFVRELVARDIRHVSEEFADGHMNVTYRYDITLPLLSQALGAARA